MNFEQEECLAFSAKLRLCHSVHGQQSAGLSRAQCKQTRKLSARSVQAVVTCCNMLQHVVTFCNSNSEHFVQHLTNADELLRTSVVKAESSSVAVCLIQTPHKP